jgi:cell division transport system ATP-binding protein
MITFKNVTKFYPPNVHALKHVNLNIKAGEFVSIVGHSGAGKSTLAKLLIAEEKPTHGEIFVGDWETSRIARGAVPMLRRQIGVVFQDFKLLPQKTVYENVAFALEVCGEPHKRIHEVVPAMLKLVKLEDKTHRYPKQISGGEQQRAVIARALVHRPKILLADEPTGNLDAIHTREIIDLLLKINEFGTTIMLVTHNREIVNSLRKRVITLEQGMVVSDKEAGKYLI